MIQVGRKEQIYSASFMVKDHEEAIISVPIANETLKISFKFVPGDENERDAAWQVENNLVKFTIKGWRNPMGTCIVDPAKFADAGNRKIYLQISQYLIGTDNNLCHIFLYLGAPNE